MFPTDYAVDPGALARMAEERGFESLLFPEHTHIPVSRDSPYPAGGELPEMYRHTYDPFVALTAAAAATERLRIGTGICLVVERDPIVTAKEVASLDRLSGGRFLFGVGAGWNREEMENHGTDPHRHLLRHVGRVHRRREDVAAPYADVVVGPVPPEGGAIGILLDRGPAVDWDLALADLPHLHRGHYYASPTFPAKSVISASSTPITTPSPI